MISTRDLSLLPDVDRLKALLQSMAMLDMILEPEWDLRYYSFNTSWATGEQMGSMRDGQGDHFFVLFNPAGCWVKGFAHEVPMSPDRTKPKRVCKGVLDAVPREFTACLGEGAFAPKETTFCIWRRYVDTSWQCGPIVYPIGHADPDGSGGLLSPLDGDPKTYQKWAKSYFSESKPTIKAVRHIYEHRPLTEALVRGLNPDVCLDDLKEDIEVIGYPTASQ